MIPGAQSTIRTIISICSVIFITSQIANAQGADTRPNVVLIVADDLGWADLGCYGSKFHRTPHLDRMASEGVRFTQGYAACPVCSPTRAAILTGKYPQRFNLTDWLPGRPDRPDQRMKRPVIRQELPLEAVTLAEMLQQGGYATGIIGKWHLGGKGFEPQQQGFLSNIGGDETGTPLSYFAPFQRNGRFMPGLETAPDGEYLTDRYAAEAEKFLDQHHDKPFFLYLPHNAVHTPLQAKPDKVAQFQEAADKSAVGTQRNPVYAAMLSSLDDAVGRVLKKLDDLKLTDNTLVMFTSDNGGLVTLEGMTSPATINSPLRDGKGFLYEGGIRVPLIVKWPARVKPAVHDATPVCSIDLLPTIVEACLGKPAEDVDGVSLLPLLLQSGSLPARDLFWHYPHYSNQGGRPGGAIRSGEFKMVHYYEDGRTEIYNVVKDPGEITNLVADPYLLHDLADKLEAWRKRVNAQPATKNPDYIPNPQDKAGNITLTGANADLWGLKLRYEPLPHKNTLGFWVNKGDWVSWQIQIDRPGKFEVEVLQGCGAGSGGSEVVIDIADQQLVMTVQDTGHFQNFVPRVIGTVEIKEAGRYFASVKPRTKPGVAVMDLRQMKLTFQSP